MKFLYIVALLLLTSTSYNANSSTFVYCDECSDSKARVQAILSGEDGIVDVGDIETGILRSFSIELNEGYGKISFTVTPIVSDYQTNYKFKKVYSQFKSAKNDIYVTTGIINTPWEARSRPQFGNQVIAQVIDAGGETLRQKASDYFQAAAILSDKFKPMEIRISTPDGGFLVFEVDAIATDGAQEYISGAFNFDKSKDGNGNPIVPPASGETYGFSGGGSGQSYAPFVNYMTNYFGLTWNGSSGTGGAGGSVMMTCRPVGDEMLCTITYIR